MRKKVPMWIAMVCLLTQCTISSLLILKLQMENKQLKTKIHVLQLEDKQWHLYK